MKLKKKDIIPYIIAGAAISVAVFALGMARENGIMRSVCDGFTVAGALLFGVGVLRWVRNRGAFDAVGYGLSSTFRIHFPAARDLRDREDFGEYLARKEKSRRPSLPILIAAGIYFAASVISLVLYYVV